MTPMLALATNLLRTVQSEQDDPNLLWELECRRAAANIAMERFRAGEIARRDYDCFNDAVLMTLRKLGRIP